MQNTRIELGLVRLREIPCDHMSMVSHTFTCCGGVRTQVGRVRANEVFGDHGLDFFVCGDQLLRGAALNAVLIAKALAAVPV